MIFWGNLLMQGKEVECDGNLLIPLILSFDQLELKENNERGVFGL